MDIVTLLPTDSIALASESSSKKRAIESLSQQLVREGDENEPSYEAIFDALIAREKLGSTTLGNGIAIPHACLDKIKAPRAALLVLEEGIKMDAPDKKPVGVLLALVVPKNVCEYHHLLSEWTAILNAKSTYADLLALGEPQLIQDYLHRLNTQGMAA